CESSLPHDLHQGQVQSEHREADLLQSHLGPFKYYVRYASIEKNFILPEEIIQEVKEGKVMIEDEVKEEIKEEMDSHTGTEDVFTSSGNLGKGAE
ncbi:MRG/MORF4L-binding protein-like, partial [Gracilinanus agilis]|uniref:MRG/MORF4L-binding protein-like n=1 Tax=Gracilinanus agilis TaxID=191870 RepID=UPI001CFCE6BF